MMTAVTRYFLSFFRRAGKVNSPRKYRMKGNEIMMPP